MCFYSALLWVFLVYRVGARRTLMMPYLRAGVQVVTVFQEGLESRVLTPNTPPFEYIYLII